MLPPVLLLTLLSVASVQAQNKCNPLTTETCPEIPGLATTSFASDFTKGGNLPAGWVLSDWSNITFDSQGAHFWYNQRGNAPYIWTDFYFTYGRVDVDLMVANGTGIITSSVLFSDAQDEVDWEFSGSNFGQNSGKAYTNYFGKGITGSYDRGHIADVNTPQKTFHTYSFDWTPDTLKWIIDGKVVHVVENNGLNSGPYQFPQTPSRLHLGLWDAGAPNTAGGTVNWAGGYTDYKTLPYQAIVQNVRLTTTNPCSSWQYPTKFSGKWSDIKCTNNTLASTTTSALPPTTTSSVVRSTASVYTVVGGDVGWKIATNLGCSMSELIAANLGVDWNALNIGQELKVPPAPATSTGSVVDLGSGAKPSSSSSTSMSSQVITAISSANVTVTSWISTITTACENGKCSHHPTSSAITVTNVVPVINSTGLGWSTATTKSCDASNRCTDVTTSNAYNITSAVTVTNTSVVNWYPTTVTSCINNKDCMLITSSIPVKISIAMTTSTTIPSGTGQSLPLGWTYKHCCTDNLDPRSLPVKADLPSEHVNATSCILWCSAKSFSMAATQYGSECWCGNQLSQSSVVPDSDCNMQCKGNNREKCGGNARLSLYSKNTTTSSAVTGLFNSSTTKQYLSSQSSTIPLDSTSSSAKLTFTITNPKTSSSSSSSSSSSPTSSLPASSPLPSMSASPTCSRDEGVNSMLSSIYSNAATTFCSKYLAGSWKGSFPIPTYAACYSRNSTRISSACSCLATASNLLAQVAPTVVTSTTPVPSKSSATLSKTTSIKDGWVDWRRNVQEDQTITQELTVTMTTERTKTQTAAAQPTAKDKQSTKSDARGNVVKASDRDDTFNEKIPNESVSDSMKSNPDKSSSKWKDNMDGPSSDAKKHDTVEGDSTDEDSHGGNRWGRAKHYMHNDHGRGRTRHKSNKLGARVHA